MSVDLSSSPGKRARDAEIDVEEPAEKRRATVTDPDSSETTELLAKKRYADKVLARALPEDRKIAARRMPDNSDKKLKAARVFSCCQYPEDLFRAAKVLAQHGLHTLVSQEDTFDMDNETMDEVGPFAPVSTLTLQRMGYPEIGKHDWHKPKDTPDYYVALPAGEQEAQYYDALSRIHNHTECDALMPPSFVLLDPERPTVSKKDLVLPPLWLERPELARLAQLRSDYDRVFYGMQVGSKRDPKGNYEYLAKRKEYNERMGRVGFPVLEIGEFSGLLDLAKGNQVFSVTIYDSDSEPRMTVTSEPFVSDSSDRQSIIDALIAALRRFADKVLDAMQAAASAGPIKMRCGTLRALHSIYDVPVDVSHAKCCTNGVCCTGMNECIHYYLNHSGDNLCSLRDHVACRKKCECLPDDPDFATIQPAYVTRLVDTLRAYGAVADLYAQRNDEISCAVQVMMNENVLPAERVEVDKDGCYDTHEIDEQKLAEIVAKYDCVLLVSSF